LETVRFRSVRDAAHLHRILSTGDATMARIARLPARFAFAAAVLGSLAFGATQAFAAPPASEARFCGTDCAWQGYKCVCW
jgi:hypothetical protein